MKRVLLLALLLSGLNRSDAQVGIGTNTPHANAQLEIADTDRGILIPRMDSNHRKNIPNTIGLLVYDSTTHSFWYNDGTLWQNLISTTKNSQTYNGGFSNFKVFEIVGLETWTAPLGVTKIMVECWGGGAGMIQFGTNSLYLGGSSGAYGKSIIDVIPNEAYNVTVGGGGQFFNSNGNPVNTSNPIYSGGTSSFGAFLYATGGQCNSSGGTSNGQFNISGSSVIDSQGTTVPLFYGGKIALAASSPNGGGAGNSPGGGGNGGDGGRGRVVVWW